MKVCEQYRQRLLSQESPTTLAPADRGHFESCPACRAWLAKVDRLEMALANLPMPVYASHAKAGFLNDFRRNQVQPATVEKGSPSWVTVAGSWLPAGGIALVLILAVAAILEIRSRQPEVITRPADPLMERVVVLNTELASAQTADERLDLLMEMSDAFEQGARKIARVDAKVETLDTLSRSYSRLVREGVVEQARLIESADREAKLDRVLERLDKTRDEAEQLAREVPPGSVAPLETIATTARQASAQVRGLRQRPQ